MSVCELETTPEVPTAVDSEGWLYNTETGEVLGLAALDPAFVIDNAEAADFALRIRSEIEGDIAGIDARLKAVTAQLQALRAAKVRRLSWWDWKFHPMLVAFARSQLTGKSRTVQFDWGRVAFRRTPGHTAIVDMGAAVEFVGSFLPERVKVVKSVDLKAVKEAIEAAERATGEPCDPPAFLASTGADESVTVSTGIEQEKGGGR